MATDGFNRREQALHAVVSDAIDMVGQARALVLNPRPAQTRLNEQGGDPDFARFGFAAAGGITAWYTMRLAELGEDREKDSTLGLPPAIRTYEERDAQRCIKWHKKFSDSEPGAGRSSKQHHYLTRTVLRFG